MTYPGLELINDARATEHETMLHLTYGDDLNFIGPCNQWTAEDFEEARFHHQRREEEMRDRDIIKLDALFGKDLPAFMR